MRRARLAAAALVLTLAPQGATPAPPGDPQVQTRSGRLAGTASGGVEAYLGVPFAAPPVGPLRWRAPQPAASWSGVRAAKAFGADCMQWPLDSVPGPGYLRPTSEDCLTLNLWRPAARPAPSTRKLPVMVWIYGGAFAMGSESWPVYNGANMARRGVIFVAANYRLARFGWFAHPALTKANADGGRLADYGLMDQIAALRWVHDNIAAFGGDPANVTVMGESAGAVSVFALMTSPAAKGLFARAIAQSGHAQGSLGALQEGDLDEAEARGLKWSRSLGVADNDVAALRALPATAVLGPKDPRVLGGIVVDGTIVPQPVNRAFMTGKFARVPVLVGSNSWEYSLLQWLPGADKGTFAQMGNAAPKLRALYEDGGKVPTETARQKLWGDNLMTASARFVARRVAAAGEPAYLYRYSYVPVAERGKIVGARHSAEVSLVLRNEVTGPQFGEGAADSTMADTISGYWLRFAKTGDPGGTPAWPAYTAASDRLMEFGDDGAQVRQHLDKDKLDLIDRVYLERQGLAAEPPLTAR